MSLATPGVRGEGVAGTIALVGALVADLLRQPPPVELGGLHEFLLAECGIDLYLRL